jgi:hypothetical protein
VLCKYPLGIIPGLILAQDRPQELLKYTIHRAHRNEFAHHWHELAGQIFPTLLLNINAKEVQSDSTLV